METIASSNLSWISSFKRWRRSLKGRFFFIYGFWSVAMIIAITSFIYASLINQMNREFERRLNDRAIVTAERFINIKTGIGETLPTNLDYTALIDKDGRLIVMSQAFRTSTVGRSLRQGEHFPYLNEQQFWLADTPMRATTQSAGDFGTVWVALPETDLRLVRDNTLRTLITALVLTVLLTLVIGRVLAQRTLGELSHAADLADSINPAQSLKPLPLPLRKDEVHSLIVAINRLLGRIETVQLREKQMIGQVAHELGAPLTALQGRLDRAAELSPMPDVVIAAQIAQELHFTSQDLMDLSRGKLDLSLAWNYVPATSLKERLTCLVPETQWRGDWNGYVLCDPDRLVRALRNLLANAARHAAGRGFSLELHTESQQLLFIVSDKGDGLPNEWGERIFEPFVSGAGSSGLGLSVARQIAHAHGGELTARNHGGGGAEFTISLPKGTIEEDSEEDKDLS